VLVPKQASFPAEALDLTALARTSALPSMTRMSSLAFGRGPGLEDALCGGLLRPVHLACQGLRSPGDTEDRHSLASFSTGSAYRTWTMRSPFTRTPRARRSTWMPPGRMDRKDTDTGFPITGFHTSRSLVSQNSPACATAADDGDHRTTTPVQEAPRRLVAARTFAQSRRAKARDAPA
jgi:hypothetical protein